MEFTDNAMATILVCSHLGIIDPTIKPYTLTEWNRFVDDLLLTEYKDPSALLSTNVDRIIIDLRYTQKQAERLKRLLSRGASIAFALDDLSNKGIHVIARGDKRYPILLKKRLLKKAPPLLFYAGNLELANKIGIAFVGSRNIDKECENFTKDLVRKAVTEKLVIYSGGARGIDTVAETTAIENGGGVVSYLTDALASKIKRKEVLERIIKNQLLLISDVNPDAGFSAGRAMNRNKFIYTSSYGAVIVASDYEKGGTWAGATENLRNGWVSSLVWDHQNFKGNQELINRGAIPIMGNETEPFLSLLEKTQIYQQEDIFSLQKRRGVVSESEDDSYALEKSFGSSNDISLTMNTNNNTNDIFNVVLPFLLDVLSEPMTVESAAEILNIETAQLKKWLERAINEGRVIKMYKPVRFVKKSD